MKERGAIVLVVAFFMISMVSAGYKCADNTNFLEDVGSLKFGERDNINGITIGLSFARDVGATGLMEADILIDSKGVTLTDQNNVTTVQFSDDSNYSISLLNSSENSATISVGSDTKSLNVFDTLTVGGIQVSLVSETGEYPGTSSVGAIVGKSKLSLSSSSNPDEIIKFKDQEHLIILDSASDSEAFIVVKKCRNESIKIVQVADTIVPVNNSLNQTNSTNNTLVNNTNNTGNNNTNNTFQNGTANQSSNNTGNFTDGQEDGGKYNGLIKTSSIIIIAVAVIIFVFLLLKHMKNKSYQNISVIPQEE